MSDRDRCLKLIEQMNAVISKNNLSWKDCEHLISEFEALSGRLYSRRNPALITETKAILKMN